MLDACTMSVQHDSKGALNVVHDVDTGKEKFSMPAAAGTPPMHMPMQLPPMLLASLDGLMHQVQPPLLLASLGCAHPVPASHCSCSC